ncbi:MAG TPA: transglutaminase domain-containing protein [Ruminococcus sp.]|nr:transglutaminase domain-containing protein [Ruminococcus sp.]
MYETENNVSFFKKYVLKYLLDPVLIYTVVIMMAIMYHYRDKLIVFYGVISVVAGFLLFRLFDYMNKHKLVGGIAYCFIGVLFYMAANICMEKGQNDYYLPFSVWFITPQVAVEYNKWYTMAVYLLFMIFMSSVIYYFTRIRYRIFMSFLVFIIPFAIYGKENETMPILFIIILSMMYILLMVYFRQLKDDENTVLVVRNETWRTVGVYTMIFAVIASLVPKPTVDTDRSLLESMISAERFTDRLVSMLSVFRDTSSGGQYRDVDNNTPLYYVKAEDGVHMKTATFTSYEYEGDVWRASDRERNEISSFDIYPEILAQPGELTEAIMKAAECDSSYAEKYGLTNFVGKEIYIPESKEISVYSVYPRPTQYAPVPEGLVSVEKTSYGGELEYMETGLVRSADRFSQHDEITFTYTPDLFFTDPTNSEIIDAISAADYEDLLRDGYDVLYDAYFNESESDYEYIEYADILDEEYESYRNYADYLDYGDEDRIYELAMEITEGCETDYEKAKAIEMYFYANDFVYDLSYVKSRGENAISFLFKTKRGVCVEYATAMILLSRAAGIPARYCEGFLVDEPFTGSGEYQDVNYVITPQHAHAYPELYINGYGWLDFEPTIADSASKEKKRSLAQTLMTAGLILLAMLVFGIIILLLYPTISHKLFLSRSRRKNSNDTVKAIMRRITRLYGISGVFTSHEVAEKVMEISGADMFDTAKLFDEVVYGELTLGDEQKNKALTEYISAFYAFKETRKKRRINTAKV